MKEKHASSVRRLQAMLKQRAEGSDISQAHFRSAVAEGGEATISSLMKLLFGATKNVTKEDMLSSIERFRSIYLDEARSADLRSPQATPLSQYAAAFDDSCRTDGRMSIRSFVTFFNGEFSEELFRYLTRHGASIEHVSASLRELVTRFREERSWRRSLEKHTDAMLGSKESILVDDLRHMLGLEPFLAGRVFSLFDASGRGRLGREELCSCLLKLTSCCREEKLRFVFSLYDANDDGALDQAELENALRSCAQESKLDLSDDAVKHLAEVLFVNMAGRERLVKFDDILKMMSSYPSTYESLSISFPAVALRRPPRQQLNTGCLHRPLKHLQTYPALWVTCIIYMAINVVIFGCRLSELLDLYPEITRIPFIVAKCAGRLLDFNVAITLVFVTKHIISRMKRMARLRKLLPLDDAIYLHRAVAYVITILSFVHVAAHIGNILVNINYNNFEVTYFLDGHDNTMIFTSGVLLTVLLILVITMSYPTIVRKSYELFYWSHNLFYVSFFVAMFPHASTFWMWFIAPAALFGLEKAVSCVMLLRSRSEVTIGRIMSSEVVYLEIRRPASTRTKLTNGDYIKLNIPAISRLEWHPFTISSSSENGARIGLHIRAVGNWTRKLQQAVQGAARSGRQEVTCVDRHGPASEINATSISFVSGCYHVGEEMSASFRSQHALQTAIDFSSEPKHGSNTLKLGGTEIADQQPVYAEIEPQSETGFNEECYPTSASGTTPACSDCDASSNLHEAVSTEQLLRPKLERKLPSVPTDHTLPRESNCWDGSTRSGSTAVPFAEAGLRWKVYVDGPFATSCSSILRTEHAVLVAGGVGVTPHAAVLEALLANVRSRTRVCPCGCAEKVFFDQQLALKQMDFIWLTKDQSAWEWFMPLFKALEKEQEGLGLKQPLVRFRLHLTSAGAASDLRTTFIQLALRAAYHCDGRDAITGLRERTRTGRPVWRKVLQKLKDSRRGRIKVFSCGPASLTDELRHHCHDMGIEYASESF